MSTRPDPERSGAVEIAARRCPRLRVVVQTCASSPQVSLQFTELLDFEKGSHMIWIIQTIYVLSYRCEYILQESVQQ